MSSPAFSWNKVDTGKIKRSAIRGVIAFLLTAGVAIGAGFDPDTQVGGIVTMALAAFGPTLVKMGQRYISDNSDEPSIMPPETKSFR